MVRMVVNKSKYFLLLAGLVLLANLSMGQTISENYLEILPRNDRNVTLGAFGHEAPFDSVPRRARKKWELYLDSMSTYLHEGRISFIGELYFFQRMPLRKNRLLVNSPFRVDASVYWRLEWNPTYERDLTGWLSLHFGPTLYRRKIWADYRGNARTGGGAPAWMTSGGEAYWIDGWGQNAGIKVFAHYHGRPDVRVGVNLTYQQRKIRVYGPINESGDVIGDYEWTIVDKTVEDGRLRTLIFGEWLGGNLFVANIYGGVGVPIWGSFKNRILDTSGSRKEEWNDAETNNIIMMRNYDVYLGASVGFYFEDFWRKRN